MKLSISVAAVLAFSRFMDCMTLFGLYGYLPQTLLYFGVSTDHFGIEVGLITNIFWIGQAIGCLGYGLALDRWDTLRILAITQFITAGLMLMLGMSLNATSLVVLQLLIGIFNGTDTALRVLFKDILVDKYDLALIYAVPISMSLSLGPSLSGILALPTEQYPNVFGNNGVLKAMPILLPNVFFSLCILCNGCAALWFLPARLRTNHQTDRLLSDKLCDANDEESKKNFYAGDMETSTKVKHQLYSITKPFRQLCRRNYILSLLAINLFWCSSNIFYVIFMLWIGSPKSMAGMGFLPAQTTIIYFLPGLLSMFLDFVLLGKLNSLVSSEIGFACWCLLKSFVVSVVMNFSPIKNQTAFAIATNIAVTLVRFATSGTNVTAIDLINNSVPKEVAGIANAIAISTASLTSTACAIGIGKVYTWSIVNDMNAEENSYTVFPFNRYFTFYINGIVSMLGGFVAAFVNSRSIRQSRFMKY